MSIAERTTQTVWEGALATGVGTFANSSSTVLDGQQVTWAARTEAPGGKMVRAGTSGCQAIQKYPLRGAQSGRAIVARLTPTPSQVSREVRGAGDCGGHRDDGAERHQEAELRRDPEPEHP